MLCANCISIKFGRRNKNSLENKKEPNKNSGAVEYNDWNEEFKRELQQQTWPIRSELEDRSTEIIQSEEQKGKGMKKM